MLYSRINICFLLLLGIGLTSLQAQQSVNTSGGIASGSEGSVSYSIGQVFNQTQTGSNGSAAEGIQQPFEILVLTGIDEAKSITLSLSAYPNPTSDYLTLDISEFDLSDFSYQLYNMNGKLLQNDKITNKKTILDLSNLIPASYFVKVMQESKEVKIFKVIKK